MAKFTKRKIVVEARQWFRCGDHPAVRSYGDACADSALHQEHCGYCGLADRLHGWIETLEGGHRVCPGDWIITGVRGEHYPCKPVVFEATYEPYTEPEQEDDHETV